MDDTFFLCLVLFLKQPRRDLYISSEKNDTCKGSRSGFQGTSHVTPKCCQEHESMLGAHGSFLEGGRL